jgi:hypothetical protein
MSDEKELKVLKIGTYTPEDIDREILHEMWAHSNTMVEEYKRQRKCYFEEIGKNLTKKQRDKVNEALDYLQTALEIYEDQIVQSLCVWGDKFLDEMIERDQNR